MENVKIFIKPDLSGTIPPLCKDGITYEENNYLIYLIFLTLAKQFSLAANIITPFSSRNMHSLESIHTHPLEAEATLNYLLAGKAAGPDGINNLPLKQLPRPLLNPLTVLFKF